MKPGFKGAHKMELQTHFAKQFCKTKTSNSISENISGIF